MCHTLTISIFAVGCSFQGDKDFTPAAAQVAHQKPVPAVQKLPTTHHFNQHIHQPRKWACTPCQTFAGTAQGQVRTTPNTRSGCPGISCRQAFHIPPPHISVPASVVLHQYHMKRSFFALFCLVDHCNTKFERLLCRSLIQNMFNQWVYFMREAWSWILL